MHYAIGAGIGICFGTIFGFGICWNWIGSLKNDLNSAHDKLDNIFRAIKGVRQ